MASLSHDKKNNRWRIQFVAPDGSRRSVSMKATRARDRGQSKAAVLKGHIEELASSVSSGTRTDSVVQRWIDSLSEKMHVQMVDAGLLTERKAPELNRLGTFLTQWFANRAGTKESTVITWRNAERNMVDHFGAEQLLADITEEDAESFERWLKTSEGLAEATKRKRLSICKQFMQSAIKARIITQNPFAGLRTGNVTNRKRQAFITPEDTQRILNACAGPEWRTLVALARYGALRIPSEVQDLKWDDINWTEDCLHVHAVKTEHHEDGGDRIVPLFLELRKELNALWDALGDQPAEHVLPKLRATGNPNTTLHRIIKRAGLPPIPKPWQNLRATRATELEAEFGAHKATEWCGHSEKVAGAHYWMVTQDDIRRAAGWSIGAHMVQQSVEDGGNGSQADSHAHEKTPVFPGSASDCETLQPVLMGDEGLEPPTPSV